MSSGSFLHVSALLYHIFTYCLSATSLVKEKTDFTQQVAEHLCTLLPPQTSQCPSPAAEAWGPGTFLCFLSSPWSSVLLGIGTPKVHALFPDSEIPHVQQKHYFLLVVMIFSFLWTPTALYSHI